MPRKYDRTIRFYDSWFGDLLDPSKEFTDSERWRIILAIRDCQVTASLQPLEDLPLEIRRALSMATMGEQIVRQLERAESMRKRGSAGGRAAAASSGDKVLPSSATLASEIAKAETAAHIAQIDAAKERANAAPKYEDLLILGAKGDAKALELLQSTVEECKTLCTAKRLKY